MLKYCRKANKRSAFPPWGIPTEMTCMRLDPAANLAGPNELNEQGEMGAIQRAEKADDEGPSRLVGFRESSKTN